MEKREIVSAIIAIMLCGVVLSFNKGELDSLLLFYSLIVSAIIILLSLASKIIVAKNLGLGMTAEIWKFQRYGIIAKQKFKKPFPIGLLAALILALITNGTLKFLAFLQFNFTALPVRVVKKYGSKRFSGIMEWDGALMVFYSTLPLLLLAVISSFFDIGIFSMISKYSLIYAISNLIPLGQLDGTKLYFGSRPLFVFTWILTAFSALFVFLQ